jgi:PAS domain S-box-containing protein
MAVEPYGYLLKPFGRRELHTAIETALAKHRMERRLREHEQWLATILRSIGDAVIATDARGRVLLVNPLAESLTGWRQDDARGRELNEVYPTVQGEARAARANPALQALQAQRSILRSEPAFLLTRTGLEVPIEDSTSLIRDEAGKVAGTVVVFRDISERRQTEAALRASQATEARLTEMQAAVLNALPAHIALLDEEGVILAANEAWRQFRASDALHGAAFEVEGNYLAACEAIAGERAAEAAAAARGIRAVIAGLEPEFALEYACHAGSEALWFRLLVAPWRSGEFEGAVVMYVNVTERKRLEEQLVQAQKMEAVGRLAGGVAHDFNNLLTAILGYSEFALAAVGEDRPLRHDLEEIHAAAERAASLTRQLLTFSRKQVLVPRVIDLNAVLSESEKMLRRLVGDAIELTLSLDPALGRIKADPGQVLQVILNLVVNARDAMTQGGKLLIRTASVPLDEAFARTRVDVRPGPYVLLAVSDTGVGMDESILAHLFEPFFTTKEVGKGTGLGLATVFGVVKQSGGLIEVESQPGKGTTVLVYLPRAEEVGPPAAAEAPAGSLRGTETILLVEDEAMVRTLVRTILQTHGYAVLEARNAEQALRVSGEYRGPIHLLLTDVLMPGMGGRDLAERLTAGRSGLKVLYMSGHTESDAIRRGIVGGEMAFLQKPFRPQVLARKVREVLDS